MKLKKPKEIAMNEATIDTVARRTASGMSRRTSLLTLAGVAMSATAPSPAATEARAKRKNGKGKALCKRLRDQCRRAIDDVCADAAFPETCRAEFLPGCDPLARCNAEAAIRQIFVLC
jgi:hypothetical protein